MKKKELAKLLNDLETQLYDLRDRVDEGIIIDNRLLGHWDRIKKDLDKEAQLIGKMRIALDKRLKSGYNNRGEK